MERNPRRERDGLSLSFLFNMFSYSKYIFRINRVCSALVSVGEEIWKWSLLRERTFLVYDETHLNQEKKSSNLFFLHDKNDFINDFNAYLFYMCVCVGVHVSEHACGDHRIACRDWFSLSERFQGSNSVTRLSSTHNLSHTCSSLFLFSGCVDNQIHTLMHARQTLCPWPGRVLVLRLINWEMMAYNNSIAIIVLICFFSSFLPSLLSSFLYSGIL